MPTTGFHLVLRLRGERLDPIALTDLLGVRPTTSFAVGENRYAHSKLIAGWDWMSRHEPALDPLVAEMFDMFEPRLDVLRSATADGASATLTVVGLICGDVVMTPAEADRRRIAVDDTEPFEPFLDADRFGLWLEPKVMAFLGAIPCALGTHVDAEIPNGGG